MIKIPEELLKKLDELIEKLASNGGGVELNVVSVARRLSHKGIL